MKNYRFFKTSSEPKVIGIRDGISQVRLFPNDEFPWNHFSWLKQFMWLEKGEKWVDLNVNHINLYEGVLEFNLEPKAKLTDVLDFSPFFYGAMIVSKRLMEILKKFNLGNVQYRPVQINSFEGLKQNFEYYMVQIPLCDFQNIDFENT